MPLARVVAKLPVPVPVTAQVSVIVWSPVFVPLVLASRVIAVSSVNLFVAVSVISSVSSVVLLK